MAFRASWRTLANSLPGFLSSRDSITAAIQPAAAKWVSPPRGRQCVETPKIPPTAETVQKTHVIELNKLGRGQATKEASNQIDAERAPATLRWRNSEIQARP